MRTEQRSLMLSSPAMRKQVLLALLICLALGVVSSATMLRERWNQDLGIMAAEELMDSGTPPDEVDILDESTWADIDDGYCARLSGWITVPVSGDYQFHFGSDDNGRLYVSQDENMENAVQVCFVDGWTNIGQWDDPEEDGQHSEIMSLRKGQVMAVYATMQEGVGGDNMQIGWTGPGLSDDIFNPTLISDWVSHIQPTLEVARGPIPGNEETDVVLDPVLAWRPGEFAATHDIYFGTSADAVNDATVANPMDVLLIQGHDANTYDPGLTLEFGQTYYWRVDEVNAPPDNTIFKGDVWSFTTEPIAYAIESIIATSNTASEPGAGPEKTVDGSGLSADGRHSTLVTDMWAGAPPAGELAYIQYELDKVYKLYELQVWNYNFMFEPLFGFGLKDVTVEYSENGADWTVLKDVQFAQATGQSSYTANTIADLEGIAARYIRLTANSAYGMMGQFGLSEVRFLYTPTQARRPEPADGATEVDVDTMLGWRAGREAASHEVYFGTDADALALVDTVAANSYTPAGLDLGTTYYWKINEVNEAEAVSLWEGNLWSFAIQDYLVVDDFDSYDDEDNRIYDTWADGWINATGSTVGHPEAPFAERSIVHAGRQSMPLLYDNTGTPTSEAELALAQDWTAHDIQSLSLYWRGAADNSGGQLYVTINDTKVPYDGDAADINGIVWQPWNIDLAATGGNFQSVTKLIVGLEGAGAQGVVYIDSIRLYPDKPEYFTPTEPDSAALVAHYALEGNPNDSSGNGYHGTEVDGVTYVAGVDGQGVLLDGLYDYIDFGTPAGWPAALEPRTMCGWGMTETVTPGWRWIAAYGNSVTSQAMFIGLNGPALYGGGYGDDVMIPDFWAENEWHHITLTYDGATARLYADGVEVAADAKDWNLVPDRAHIGRMISDDIEFWMGVVDEVRLYNKVLSTGEIAWLAGRRAPVHKPF